MKKRNRCGKCKLLKPLSDFHKRKNGVQSWCKACVREYQNTDDYRAYRVKWAKDNPDKRIQQASRVRANNPDFTHLRFEKFKETHGVTPHKFANEKSRKYAGNHRSKWTKDEELSVCDYSVPDTEHAKRLGRTKIAIERKRRQLRERGVLMRQINYMIFEKPIGAKRWTRSSDRLEGMGYANIFSRKESAEEFILRLPKERNGKKWIYTVFECAQLSCSTQNH